MRKTKTRGTPTAAFEAVCRGRRINPISFLFNLEMKKRISRKQENIYYIEIGGKMVKLPKKIFFREILTQHPELFGENAVEQYEKFLRPMEHKKPQKAGRPRKWKLRPGETLIRSKPQLLIVFGKVKTVSVRGRTAVASRARGIGLPPQRILIYVPQKGEQAAQPLYSVTRIVTIGGKRWEPMVGYTIYDFRKKIRYNLLKEERATGTLKQLINIFKTFG